MRRKLMQLMCVIVMWFTVLTVPHAIAQPRIAEFPLDCAEAGHPAVCIEGISLVQPSGDGFTVQESYVYHSYPIKNMWKPASWASISDPSIMVSFTEDDIINPMGSMRLMTTNITSTQYISVTMRAPTMTDYFPPLLVISQVGDFTARTSAKTFTMIAQSHRFYDALMGGEIQVWSFNYFTDVGLLDYMSAGCVALLKGATEADRQSVILDGKSMMSNAGGLGGSEEPTVQQTTGQITLGLSEDMFDAIDFQGRFPHDYLQSSACKWGADYDIPAEEDDPVESDDFVAELAGVELDTTATIYPDAVEVTVQNASGGASVLAGILGTKASTKQLQLYTMKAQSLATTLGSSDMYVGQTLKLPSKTDQKQTLSWSSANANCTVAKGVVTVVGAGACSLTASAPSKSRLKAFSQSYTFNGLAKLSHAITNTFPDDIVGTNQVEIPSQTDALASITWQIAKESTKICGLKKVGTATYLEGKTVGTCLYQGRTSASVSHHAFVSDVYTTDILAKDIQTMATVADIMVGQVLNLPTQSTEGVAVTWKTKSKTCKVIKQNTPPLFKAQGVSAGACILNASNRGDATYQALNLDMTIQVVN
jgi:hypothetical protein